jgi:hypothetical protein
MPNPAASFARVVRSRRYTSATRVPLGRAGLAASVTSLDDDEHRDPLHECLRQVECARMGHQRGPSLKN